jgi:hypothetical protein
MKATDIPFQLGIYLDNNNNNNNKVEDTVHNHTMALQLLSTCYRFPVLLAGG